MDAKEEKPDCSKQQYFPHLIYVLATHHQLHKPDSLTKILKHMEWTALGMILGIIVGMSFAKLKLLNIYMDEAMLGSTLGALLFFAWQDPASYGIFSMIQNLKKMANEQQLSLENSVHQLVGSSFIKELDNFVQVPQKCSALLKLLKDRESKTD